ncbi:MAG: glycosyltransferase family 4 protein [Actinobacteria bacterium]|nr:glycosyltransferase family 4 protein [Actinomycetota bacterium]
MPGAAFISFRLGGVDGVSVEARKWEWAFHELGFNVRRIAGELVDGLRPDDTWLPFLAITPVPGARVEPDALAASIAGADVVVVENLCSLPLNLEASTIAAEVLSAYEGRVVFHHHDLPWERPHLAHLQGFPPQRTNSLHITINRLAAHALEQRGIEAHLVRNAFDLQPPQGDRAGTRASLGFQPDHLVVLQPTRAIPRKEVQRGIAFAQALQAHVGTRSVQFWLTGPAEDGYGPELEELVASAGLPVTEGRAARPEDAYAAADVVVFPSSWEGFGNPVIEATVAGKPVVVAHYPVLDELIDLGLNLLSIDDPGRVAEVVRDPSLRDDDANREFLRKHFDLNDLPARLRDAFAAVGWEEW